MRERIETKKFEKIKTEIRRRDNHTCQLCEKKFWGKRLQVHHIMTYANNPYLIYDKLNLISLCWDCHKKITKNEVHYVALLSRKARENAKNYRAAKGAGRKDSDGN